MHTIPQNEALANMPMAELDAAIEQFLQPVTDRLPDKRLGRVVRLAVQGISCSQSPLLRRWLMVWSEPAKRSGQWPNISIAC